jgi:hypothetical protein
MITTEIVSGCECDFYPLDDRGRWQGECDALGLTVEGDSFEEARESLQASIGLMRAGRRAGL